MSLNLKISFVFLSIFLFFKPLYKYFEYVFNFPRINISIIYFLLFLGLILSTIYYLKDNYNQKILSSFWLLLMVSVIQLISFPWAVDYSNDGLRIYLITISRSLVQYWLFWFAGLYIKDILGNDKFWKLMSYLWLTLVCMILYSAFSNNIFGIMLDGAGIYLMLADSFAIFSIFILCVTKNTKKQTFIIFVAIICLFALFSRSSLYCFVIVAFLFLYNQNKKVFFISLLSFVAFIYFSVNNGLIEDRMLRLLVGASDTSQNMRQEHLIRGLNHLSNNWLLGTFMGDIESNFGNEGRYIHNYLSFWRQFGLIPFLVFFLLLGYKSISVCYEWLRDKNFNPVVQFLFYFTIFALLEIVIARSYVFPYIWLSISGIAVFMGSKRQKNESNE